MEPEGERERHSAAFLGYLVFTAALCGALVMVVEVLGSRVMGPVFGVSLFVWTSLITVTLIALALGYAAGGILADRKGSPDYLYGLIVVAGLLVLAIPPLRGPVLKASLPLGLRAGSLFGSALLFGPALFLLGCVSPYIVKIAVREMRNIGRTVGLFYAVSTFGSFVGTVLTGFVLIAWFGVTRILVFAGLLLVLLGLGYFAVYRKKAALLALPVIPLLLFGGDAPSAVTLPDGTRLSAVLSRDTFYGRLKVVDRTTPSHRYREMMIDGLVQGGVDLENDLSLYSYSYFLEFLPYGLNPAGKDCLVVGLGAGVVPMWYERKGIRTDVVEISPDVVDAAKEFFRFRLEGDLYIEDARFHMVNSKKQYDYIILDVFTGDTTPSHLLSVEYFRLLRPRLREGGVLAMNFHGSLGDEVALAASVALTLREVFPQVEVYPLFSPDADPPIGNIILVGYAGPPRTLNSDLVLDDPVHFRVVGTVGSSLGVQYRFPAGTPGFVLSDDYNPVEFLGKRLTAASRGYVLTHTPVDILL